MKTIFTALALTAISISAQAASQITGVTGTNVNISQVGNTTTISGSNLNLSNANINVPGTLIIQSGNTNLSRIPSGDLGCGACVTAVNTPGYIPGVVSSQPVDLSTFQTTTTITQTATINAGNLTAVGYAGAKQPVMPGALAALPDLSKLEPSGDMHAHPEFMNLSGVAEDVLPK